MVKFLKQSGKAICYMGTTIGMQFVAYLIFMFWYIYDSLRDILYMTDKEINAVQQRLPLNLYNYLMDNSNWIYILYGILSISFFWFIFAIRKKKLLKEARVIPFDPKKIIPVLLLAVSSCLMIQWAFWALPIPEDVLTEYDEAVSMAVEGGTAMIIATNVFVAPIVEEITFRGLALSRLAKIMPITLASVLTSGIFGVIHGQILWICYATLLGILMSFIAVQCESVLASILFHMIFNLLGSFPILESILGYSMTAITIAGVVGLVVSIAIIFWMIRDRKKQMLTQR